ILDDGMTAMPDVFSVAMINVPGFDPSSLSDNVTTLIVRGGIFSMTTIVVTIFCGYAFAGIVEVAGCLDKILSAFSKMIESTWKLIGVTILGSIIVFTAGVASISIIMVGVLLQDAYAKQGLHAKNLSRTLEDSGTML